MTNDKPERITVKRRTLLQLAAGAAAAGILPRTAIAAAGQSAAPLEELRLDYAYYSPTSLVLRRFGWLEQEFRADGTNIKWGLCCINQARPA